jgi:hypothetical protein
MTKSAPLLLVVASILIQHPGAAIAADSDYSDALKLKKQIEQMTGGKGSAAASEPAASAPASASLHLDAPARKPGWWEFAALGQSGKAIGKQNLCIGEGSEKVYSAFDQLTGEAMTGIPCTRREFTQTADGWAFETSCKPMDLPGFGDLTINAKGVILGDIATQYEVRQTVISGGTTMKGSILAAWKGDCPAGRKDGDLVDETGDLLLNVVGP